MTTLFLYGTLKRGQRNHHFLAGAECLGAARSLSRYRLVEVGPFPGLVEMQGKLEGMVTRSAVAGGQLARMLIAVGDSLGRVPEFALDLRRMNLRELLEFHAELETRSVYRFRAGLAYNNPRPR